MDKIAAEAAKEIFRLIDDSVSEYQYDPPNDAELTAIIQSALSQSLAARDKEIEELANKWIREANMLRWEQGKDKAAELLALLKGKAI